MQRGMLGEFSLTIELSREMENADEMGEIG